MSLAAETREAVRQRPTLYDGLRAGIINYTAAAEQLDLDGDREAIAAALRRFAESISENADSDPTADRSLTVRMNRGVDPDEATSLPVLNGDEVATDGPVTAIRASGDVDAAVLASALDRLRIADIDVVAAGVTSETLVILVEQRAGANALQLVEGVA